jgi:ABC-type phosphate/phosphonate transport system substrate-binding protein
MNLVDVGSFAQALLHARGLGVPIVQGITGQEMYAGVMIYPAGQDPEAILREHPSEVAFAAGASSGESSAKAATDGKAAVRLPSHKAVAGAVNVGKASAGFVKNWWWEANKANFPKLAMYQVPDISQLGNPDHVLTASKNVPADMRDKITAAALAHPEALGAQKVVPFDGSQLAFSLGLMKKGQIDPMTYEWN